MGSIKAFLWKIGLYFGDSCPYCGKQLYELYEHSFTKTRFRCETRGCKLNG